MIILLQVSAVQNDNLKEKENIVKMKNDSQSQLNYSEFTSAEEQFPTVHTNLSRFYLLQKHHQGQYSLTILKYIPCLLLQDFVL